MTYLRILYVRVIGNNNARSYLARHWRTVWSKASFSVAYQNLTGRVW